MKICPVSAMLFCVDRRTDGQTNMTKLIVVFRNFLNGALEHSRLSDLSKKILKYVYIA